MLVMAAVVGFMVASGVKDKETKHDVIRMLAPVGLVGGLFSVMMFFYYLQTLPINARIMLKAVLLPKYAAGMITVAMATGSLPRAHVDTAAVLSCGWLFPCFSSLRS